MKSVVNVVSRRYDGSKYQSKIPFQPSPLPFFSVQKVSSKMDLILHKETILGFKFSKRINLNQENSSPSPTEQNVSLNSSSICLSK